MKRISLGLWSMVALVAAGCAASPAPVPVQAVSKPQVAARALAVASADRATFRRADANADGVLSPAELPHHPARAFASLDADGDGRLTFAEAMSQAPSATARAEAALNAEAAAETASLEDEAPALPAAASSQPVLLVPGYMDFEFFFAKLKNRLHAEGRTTSYLSVWPNISDIAMTAEVLQSQIREVKGKAGTAKVDIVAHSMGGLISRYYVKHLGGLGEVDHLITLATPHHGTIVSYLGPGQGAKQMHPNSPFLQALNAGDETPGAIKYTSIRAGLDEIVIPHSSPIWEGAENHLVRFAEHGTIFIHPGTWRHVKAALAK